ncbi:MAG: carboxypeptidase regulatory-like domain-containing protein [Vicinamibacteraceae bacterium]
MMTMASRMVRVALYLLCALLGSVASLWAQSAATSSLAGTVVDAGNAVIVDATVTVSEGATGVSRRARTDEEGSFLLPLLPPGRYLVRIEQAGFQTVTSEAITLEVAEQRRVELRMAVDDVSEAVTVEASASRTTDSDLSLVVNERRIRELPLNGKNFLRLVQLTPGVAAPGPNPLYNGGRPPTNTYLIDGVSSTDQRGTRGLAVSGGAALFADASPNLISTEALREFRVISSNADATFGRTSGGQISIITKSGTNDLHGSTYYHLRNDALDARSFFNDGPFVDEEGRSKVPPFKQHQYGATTGGPIRTSRDFFFASFEGFRQKQQQTDASTVLPNAALIDLIPGDLGRFYRTFYLDRGVVPATGNLAGEFRPVYASEQERQAFLDAGFTPAAFDGNVANGEAGAVRISSSRTQDVDQDSGLIRTDHRLTDRLTASARYAFARTERLTSSPAIPSSNFIVPLRWHHPVVQASYVIGPTQYLEGRAGVLRSTYREGNASAVDSRLLAIGVSDLGLSIRANDTAFSQLNVDPPASFYDHQTVPDVSLLHVWNRGRLTLRSGLQWRKSFMATFAGGGASPLYVFSGYLGPNGLLGERADQPEAVAASLNLSWLGTGGGATTGLRGYHQTEHESFTQADVRVNTQLTVNAGLRYSYFGVLSEENGFLSNLYAVDADGQVVPDESPFHFGRLNNRVELVGSGRPFYQPDRNNFQPRVGAAWNVGGSDLTVVRASYGLYTDRLTQLMVASAPYSTPFSTSGAAASVPFRLNGELPELESTANVGIFGFDPTIRNPTVHRYHATLEQRLDDATTVAVSYVGAAGRNLTRTAKVNGDYGVPQGRRPDSRFDVIEITKGDATSDYNSLQILGRRRWTAGLDVTVAYTYAVAKDNITQDTFYSPPAVINVGGSPEPGFQGGGPDAWIDRPLSANWGYGDFDQRHHLAVSYVWELPVGEGRRFLSSEGALGTILGGFSLSGIAIFRSGQPVDPRYSGDFADIGGGWVRPVLLSGSLDDIYARDAASRTQYLIPVAEARARLANANVTNPSTWIERNALRGPGVYTVDVSLTRSIALTGRTNLSFQVNAFNLFNRTNLGSPNNDLGSAFFGQITSLAVGTTPRQLQLGLRLTF